MHRSPDPLVLALMFGPGSWPAVRYDSASGLWRMLYTPNPTVASGGGDYRTAQVYAVCSKSLAYGSWSYAPHNPRGGGGCIRPADPQP